MNAAFLLVTSAMLVGQGADKKPVAAPPPAATTAPAVVSSGCGCDPCGCEGFGHRLRDRLRGLFNRDNCDSCQPTTCHTTHVRSHVTSNCDSCQPRIFNWQPKCHSHNACAPATCNDSCGHGHVGIFERLRGAFSRGGSCCEGDCNGGGCGTVTTAPTTGPAKTSEPIANPPKKLPAPPTPTPAPAKKAGSVSIGAPVAPATPNTISVAPSIPSVELAPVPAPRVEGDRRDPF